MDRETYERMVKNSTNGTTQSSRAARQKQIRREKQKKALATLCVGVALFTAITMQGAKALFNKIGENWEVGQSISEFHKEVVYENTHRTQDGQHYWYDYYEIGKEVKTDEDVYKLLMDIGEYQTNKVLETKKDFSPTVEDYIKDHNYKDKKDFTETNFKKILIQNDIEQSQQELNKMQHELEESKIVQAETSELGGK